MKQISFCCHGNIFINANKNLYKPCLVHCICEPNLTFMAFMLLELFTIMLSKCSYTLEPRLQTTHRETLIRIIHLTLSDYTGCPKKVHKFEKCVARL